MQIRNIDSQVSLDITYGNDFEFSGNDRRNPLFFDPVIVRGRNGGSYLQTSKLGRELWDSVSRLCYDKDPDIAGNIDQIEGFHEIRGDKYDDVITTSIQTGRYDKNSLSFRLSRREDENLGRKKELSLILRRTGEMAAGILIVSERQFQQFINLALAIQAFRMSDEYKRIS